MAKVGRKLLSEIERLGNYKKVDEFFKTEESLLNYLYRLDKKGAREVARQMINLVESNSKGETQKDVKRYFITLCAIVTRRLVGDHLTASQGYAFNTTCIMLIEQRLTEDNAVQLADELIEFFIYMMSEQSPPVLPHYTVNQVIHYINQEVESAMTVEGIAKMFDVSTSHLSRVFREHTGITLVEYINIRKVEESQYYLRFSSKRISAISDQFHFCNQSYFTRIFKKYTGETPRKFRNHLAGSYFYFTFPAEKTTK